MQRIENLPSFICFNNHQLMKVRNIVRDLNSSSHIKRFFIQTFWGNIDNKGLAQAMIG